MWLSLPKLDTFRDNSKATPERRTGDLLVAESRRDFLVLVDEKRST